MPPAADTRTVNDNLIPLNQLVEGVPPVVSQGIMAGLMVDQQLRLRSMRQLIQAVYYATYEAPVPTPQPEETTGEYVPGPQPEKKKNWFVRLPVWAKVLLICLPFVVLVIVLLWVLMMPDYGPSEQPYSSLNSSATSQIVSTVSPSGSGTSSGGEESGTSSAGFDTVMIRVDDLRSHQLEAVMNSDIAQQFNIVTTEEYSNTIENGFIISQSLEPGTVAAQGSTLELVVSKGKQNVIVPSYSGYSLNSYINELENLGFTVTVEQQYSDTVTSGSIIGTNPAVGTSVDRSVSSAITVYQSLGRDPATISSTPTSSSTPESSFLHLLRGRANLFRWRNHHGAGPGTGSGGLRIWEKPPVIRKQRPSSPAMRADPSWVGSLFLQADPSASRTKAESRLMEPTLYPVVSPCQAQVHIAPGCHRPGPVFSFSIRSRCHSHSRSHSRCCWCCWCRSCRIRRSRSTAG